MTEVAGGLTRRDGAENRCPHRNPFSLGLRSRWGSNASTITEGGNPPFRRSALFPVVPLPLKTKAQTRLPLPGQSAAVECPIPEQGRGGEKV